MMWLNELNYSNSMKTTKNWVDALTNPKYGKSLKIYSKLFFKRNKNLCPCEVYIEIGKS